MEYFKEDMFTERLGDNGEYGFKIDGHYKNWQTMVLSSLIFEQISGPTGAIDRYGDYCHAGIDIGPIWGYVYEQLERLQVNFESGDPDADHGYDLDGPRKLCMESAIVQYLEYLDTKGYVNDLGSRMGHDDEISVALTPKFLRNIGTS